MLIKTDRQMKRVDIPDGSMILDSDMPPAPLIKSKSEITMGKVGLFKLSKPELEASDKLMDDVSSPVHIKEEVNVKMEVEEPKQRRKSKRRSKKAVFIEFNKQTFELKVLVEKTKGEKVKTKVHKQTVLKQKKVEKAKSKENKTPKKTLKLKTKRN